MPLPTARNRYDDTWLREQVSRAQRDGIDLLIISHEAMSLFDAVALARIRAALDHRHPVRYVVAFRHWCSYLPSRWTQNCKRRDGLSFPAFLNCLDGASGAWLRFDRVLMNAKSAGFEDISVVSYDRSTQGGTLEADLAAACGVEVRPGARASNVSSPTALSDRLRLFNAVRAEMEGRPVDAMLQAHEGIRPVDRFFDQAGDVEDALGQDGELQEILDARIVRQRVPVTLEPDRFADLATQLETLAGPLFPTIKAHHGEYSTLEAGDLGPLRGRMWAALRSGARRRRPSLMSRLVRRIRP